MTSWSLGVTIYAETIILTNKTQTIMALIICPECKQNVSSLADKCPYCGLPQSHFNQPQPNAEISNNQPQMFHQPNVGHQQTINPVQPIVAAKPPKPNNYMGLAIIAFLIGGFIFGIVSYMYSSKIDTLWLSGNYTEAITASNNAKIWAVIGISIGAITVVSGFATFCILIF